jgi:thioredoxin-related protein
MTVFHSGCRAGHLLGRGHGDGAGAHEHEPQQQQGREMAAMVAGAAQGVQGHGRIGAQYAGEPRPNPAARRHFASRPRQAWRGGLLPTICAMRRRVLLSMFTAMAMAMAIATSGVPAWSADGLPDRFDPRRDAAADLQRALTLASQQGKHVFVDLGGEWCTWCHVFDRFVADSPEVRRTLGEHFVFLKVNYSPQNKNEAILSRWPKARGYPHFYLLDASGKVIASQPSAELESGKDYDEAKVLAFLRRHVPVR